MLFAFGPYELHVARRRLVRQGESLHLTPKAFDLLTLLVREAPSVITKTQLHERLWPKTYVADSTLAGLVKELRRALDDGDSTATHAAPIIRTVHSVGYAFALNVEQREPVSIRPNSGSSAPRHWIVIGGRRVLLHEGGNLIGRDDSADIRLDASSVSRRHAQIVIGREGVQLEDLGSKNGTRVHEQPVTGPVGLRDGDALSFGLVIAIYRCSTAGVSTQTQVGTAALSADNVRSFERNA